MNDCAYLEILDILDDIDEFKLNLNYLRTLITENTSVIDNVQDDFNHIVANLNYLKYMLTHS